MKTVFGLFGIQEDVGRAVELLNEKDLDKDLKVFHFNATGASRQSTSEQSEKDKEEKGILSAISSRYKNPFWIDSPSDRVKRAGIGSLKKYLIDRGLQDEEAIFLQDSVERGGTLLVLEVEENEVPLVEDFLDNAKVIVR